MSEQDILEQMMRRMNQLENDLRRVESQVPLYQIWNTNSPAQITANQNNYDPGDYAVLWLSTDASRNITGFQGGTEGRPLWIYNAGAQNIVMIHNSALSDTTNRIACPAAADITLATRRSCLLIYRAVSPTSPWRMFYSS